MDCQVCGREITEDNPETRECPECYLKRCETCDMGVGTRCVACEEGWDDDDSQ